MNNDDARIPGPTPPLSDGKGSSVRAVRCRYRASSPARRRIQLHPEEQGLLGPTTPETTAPTQHQ